VLTVILTIMWRPICSADSYCDKSRGLYVVLTVIMSIKGMSMCSVNSYCDNKEKVYMEC
jgi:hypothetical protein